MKGLKSVCHHATHFAMAMLVSVFASVCVAETVPAVSAKQTSASQAEVVPMGAVINLNKADAQTLAQLHGVGEKKAEAIIAYRQANGGFKSVDELSKVKGIGEKTLEKNRSRLSVN